MQIEPLTRVGQVQEGDILLLEDAKGRVLRVNAQEVIRPGVVDDSNGEEIVFNRRRNDYFITALYLAGKSWVKDARIVVPGNVPLLANPSEGPQ